MLAPYTSTLQERSPLANIPSFTRKEAMKIAFERAGGKPTDEPTAAARRESSGDPEKDFEAAMISVREAMNRLANALAKEFADFNKKIEEEQSNG